jgi:Integrase core domain
LADARRIIEDWRLDFIQNRPHSSLGNLTPEEYRDSYTMRIARLDCHYERTKDRGQAIPNAS